ncbi:MAG: translocation/assembly module TamB domain-containing protein [Nitrospiria bacterium]
MSKKWVLIPLIVFILLVIGSHLFFQSGYVSEKAREISETRLNNLLAGEVRIRSARVNLFSASVSLKGVSIESQKSEPPAKLIAERVRMAFSPWSLFMEAFMIGEVAIDSPVLVLTEQTLNEIRSVFPPSGAEKKEAPPKVVVRSILISNGSVSYQGGNANEKISLDKMNLKIDPNLKMDRFEVELSGKEVALSTGKGNGRLDRFEVKMLVQPDKINIEKAWFASRQFTLLSEGVFTFGTQKPLDFSFDAQIPISNFDPTRQGAPEDIFFRGKKLSGEAVLLGKLSGSLSSPDLKGRLMLSPLSLDGKEIGTVGANISYQKGLLSFDSVSGEVFPGSFSGNGQMILPFGPHPDKESNETYQLNLKYRGISLHRVLQNIRGDEAKGNALSEGIFLDGNFTLSGSKFDKQDFTAKGHLNAIRHPLFSPALPVKAKRFPLLMSLFRNGSMQWLWSRGRLHLEKGKIAFPDAGVDFFGKWDTESGLKLNTKAQSKEVKVLASRLRIPLTGQMQLEGVLAGPMTHPAFKGNVLFEKWALRGQSFGTLSSQISYANKIITLKRGEVKDSAPGSRPRTMKQGKGKRDVFRYQFEGDVGYEKYPIPSFDLRVNLKSADPLEVLTVFKRPIPLNTLVTGHLHIQGTPRALNVEGPLILSKGALYGESFDRGKLELTVTEKKVGFRNVVLEKKHTRFVGEGEMGYRGSYRLALRGKNLNLHKTAYFQSRLPFLAGEVGVKVSGKGSFKDPGLKVLVDISDLRYGEMEGGQGKLRIDWKDREIKLEGKLPRKNLQLEAKVAMTGPYPFSFKSHFDSLQLAPFFRAHLRGLISDVGIQLTGKMEGQGEFSHLEHVNLEGAFSTILADFSGYEIQNDGDITVHSEEGDFQIKDSRFKGENTALSFSGNMALLRSWDILMEGEADLNLIKFFTKEIASGSGKALLNLRVSEDWETPNINGILHLKNGKIRTATFSRTVLIDSLELVFNQDHLLLETFEGKVGGGRFQGSGKAHISGFNLKSFGFLLTLKNAGVQILPKLVATVDGDLLFQRDEKGQSLRGELKLKRAVYEQRTDLKSIITKFNKKKGQALWRDAPISGRTKLNVHLYGREGVWINNNVAKIPLSLDLFLKGSNERPLLLGRIDLPRGKIFLRRNHFRVISGAVDFLNPEKIDPTFDIHAKTDVRNYATDQTYKVELSLRGTLSQITLSLQSSPSLPQADILALLTLGKTTADIADGGAGGEATAFVVSELLEEPVQKVTGVDRIQVNPTIGESNGSKTTTGTRFTAEKRLLEDRLIVVYSTTLDPSEEDLIRMVYEVNKNVSLVGNRDDRGEIGGDVRFRFEFR